MTDLAPKPKLKSSLTPQKNVSKSTSNTTKKYSSSGDGIVKPPVNKHTDKSDKMPNPWLFETTPPTIDNTASFVEYLRWMREPDYQYKDGTKVEILHKAQEKARNYSSRLNILNQRTRLMAEVSFEAKSSWRLRVGGHRGPENILLPAFDALGMPYLPSSSLRGVARNYGIRELMHNESITWKEAEKKIAIYFGSIDTDNKANQAGKVIFFDAYPTSGCVEMDMANNIWTWENNHLEYSPNPNPLLSLKDATFVIGLRLANNCKNKEILDTVKNWLIQGLQEGIGSQINSGYGQLLEVPISKGDLGGSKSYTKGDLGRITRGIKSEFLRVELGWQGQLIHGCQAFTQWTQNRNGQWQMRGRAKAEVRSIAFKSMLRYWFRAFALGVLPATEVQEWEGKLFGSINPNQHRGYLQCNILEGKLIQKEAQQRNNDPGEQSGILTLSYSSESAVNQHQSIKKLMDNLTWMMLNLGGIGQGARRPCYSRENRQTAPWWRGSTFFIDSEDTFWKTGKTAKEFHGKFRKKLIAFYDALGTLIGKNINYQNLRNNGQVTQRDWQEAIDINCKIIVCSGEENFNKPYGLATLHSQTLKRNGNYDGDLCGKVQGGVKPSPVWVTDGGDYHVVTVFGATQNPRKKYLEELKNKAKTGTYHQIFPF